MSETSEHLRELLHKLRQTGSLPPAELTELIQAQDIDMQTGPSIGEHVPEFRLPDGNGRMWSLPELSGSQGLFLLFYRSADW